MLRSYKYANDKKWASIVGVKKDKSNRLAINGPGLYLSEYSHNSTSYGSDLIVVEVPYDVQLSEINDETKRWRLLTEPSSQVRFIDSKDFFKTILDSNQILNFDILQQIGIGSILFSKPEVFGDLYLLYKHKVSSRFNIEILEEYYLKKIKYSPDFFALDKYKKIYSPMLIRQARIAGTNLPDWIPEHIKENLNLTLSSSEIRSLFKLSRRFIDKEHIDAILIENGFSSTQIRSLKSDYPSKELDSFFLNFNYELYGKESFNAWLNAYFYIERESFSRMPTYDDYLKLHQIVYPKEAGDFISYKSSVAFKKNSQVYNPRGNLRNGPIYMNSGTIDHNGERHSLTQIQIDKLTNNPHLILTTDAKGKAKIQAPYSDSFEEDIRDLFAQLQRDLNDFEKEKINLDKHKAKKTLATIVGGFYWELSSRHPFWDGSGRTTRLLRDWIILNQGYVPPAENSQFDWEMSKDEYIRSLEITEGYSLPRRVFNFANLLTQKPTLGLDSHLLTNEKTLSKSVENLILQCKLLFN